MMSDKKKVILSLKSFTELEKGIYEEYQKGSFKKYGR